MGEMTERPFGSWVLLIKAAEKFVYRAGRCVGSLICDLTLRDIDHELGELGGIAGALFGS
jgi:hypothetical protein